MKTTCCSDKCERRFECAKHDTNNEGISVCENFYSFGTGTMTEDGCEIDHWCGELGNWRMFEPIEKTCSGCVYEDVDGSTNTISNCVCCSRNVDFAKNDNYKRK